MTRWCDQLARRGPLEVTSMTRCVLAASFGLALLTAGAGFPAGGDDSIRIDPEKSDLTLVLNLRVPGSEKYAKVMGLLSKAEERGVTHWTLGGSKEGEGASADLVAQPKAPSKHVAAVVK